MRPDQIERPVQRPRCPCGSNAWHVINLRWQGKPHALHLCGPCKAEFWRQRHKLAAERSPAQSDAV